MGRGGGEASLSLAELMFPVPSPALNSTCNMHDEFECGNGDCIDFSRTCDGVVHCKDKSDEKQSYCSKVPPLAALLKHTHAPPSTRRHPARAVSSVQQREPGLLGVFSCPSSACSPSCPLRDGPSQSLRAPDLFQFWGAGWRVGHLELTWWVLQHPPSNTSPHSSAGRGLCWAKAKLNPAMLPVQHEGACFLICLCSFFPC